MNDSQKEKLAKTLHRLYWENFLSMREIANHPSMKEFKVTTAPQVFYYLNKFHIDTRPRNGWWKPSWENSIRRNESIAKKRK